MMQKPPGKVVVSLVGANAEVKEGSVFDGVNLTGIEITGPAPTSAEPIPSDVQVSAVGEGATFQGTAKNANLKGYVRNTPEVPAATSLPVEAQEEKEPHHKHHKKEKKDKKSKKEKKGNVTVSGITNTGDNNKSKIKGTTIIGQQKNYYTSSQHEQRVPSAPSEAPISQQYGIDSSHLQTKEKHMAFGQKAELLAQPAAAQAQQLSLEFIREKLLFIKELESLPVEMRAAVGAILLGDIVKLQQALNTDRHAALREDSNGNVLMHYAAFKGDVRALELIEQHRGDNAAQNKFKIQPLHLAAMMGREKAMKDFFFQKVIAKVSINIRLAEVTLSAAPLHLAVLNGQIGMVKLLIEKYPEEIQVPSFGNILHLAIYSRDPWVLRELAYHSLVMKDASLYNQTSNERRLTPLALAAVEENIAAVRILAAHPHVQLNHQSQHKLRTALHYAAKGQKPEIIDALLGSISNAVVAVELGSKPDGSKHMYQPFQLAYKRYEFFRAAASAEKNEKMRKEKEEKAFDYQAISNTLKNFNNAAWTNLRQRPNYKRPLIRNLVFQGGGPKGIVHVGALAALGEKLSQSNWSIGAIERVAGTSAGAITAAAVAMNFSPERINTELGQLDMKTLIDGIDVDRLLKALSRVKKKVAEGSLSKTDAAALVLGVTKDVANLRNSVSAGVYLFRHREEIFEKFKEFNGLCSGDKFLEWFKGIIDRKLRDDKVHLDKNYGEEWVRLGLTFGKLKRLIQDTNYNYKHLYMVATCVTGTPHPVIISSEDERWDDVLIADAVRASMSIPGVFKPYKLTWFEGPAGERQKREAEFLDGGMLMNFPIKLFDKVKYLKRFLQGAEDYEIFNEETLGFRIVHEEAQHTLDKFERIEDAITFVKQIMNVFYEAESLIATAENRYQYRCIPISDCGVGTLDFNLSEAKKKDMIKKGGEAVETFFKGYDVLPEQAIQPPVAASPKV